jgi:superfamily II DNA or RNA helicase
MSITLRPYQQKLYQDILDAWASGARNVLAVASTGAGKTRVFSHAIAQHAGASVAIVHRHELVGQISLALAQNGVRHRMIGQKALIRSCIQLHMSELGRSFYNPEAPAAVAGVQTLVKMPTNDPWFKRVSLWVGDELHHTLRENQWGKAVEMFPNARGLGVTATPVRADGKGLGRHADGVMDVMVEAPGMRELIDMGYLADYRIFVPPGDVDVSNVPISAGGDYSPAPLRLAVHKSHITGDVVQHYLKAVPGKLGITFAVDVESATEIAAAFRQAGVPSEVLSAKTPPALRAAILRRFIQGEVKQLVNVDLFDEGFDCAGVEVVSMARPTQSYAKFSQQFGRAMRPKPNGGMAIILDHVGNVLRHGLPDAPRVWTLDRRERQSRGAPDDVIPVRSCPECTAAYERTHHCCPFCGYYPEPASRSGPEYVDGDLSELSPEVLARLRGQIDPALKLPYGATPAIVGSLKKHHHAAAQAQIALREAMAQWGGNRLAEGIDLRTAQRLFFHRYGVDVLTAQTLGRAEAEQLTLRIT